MIPILYEKDETAFVSNGLGRLRDAIQVLCSEERNGLYEVDFSYPTKGAHFDEIQVGRIIGVTHDDTGDIQPFDIVGYSKPIDGVVEFHAVHISYRQSYMTMNGGSINTLANALLWCKHATNLGNDGNPFNYSTDMTKSGYCAAISVIPQTVRSVLGGIEGSILDTYGGEYEWDRWNVILHSARGQMRDFSIRYGVNMLDYEEDYDCQGSFSSCIPYWTDGEDTVVAGQVDSGNSTITGRGECMPLDLSDKFESKPSSAQLQAAALSYMNSNNTYLPTKNIHVEFVRLQDMPEYAGLANLLTCGLCDTIRVIFPDYNSSGYFKIVKTVWNVLENRYESMELGDLSVSLAEALGVQPGSDTLQNAGIYVKKSGDTMSGALTVQAAVTATKFQVSGHTSEIGKVLNGTRVSGAGTVGTSYGTVASVTLDPGTWVITAFNSFNGSYNGNSVAAGTRRVLITSNSSGTTDAAEGSATGYAPAGTQIAVSTAVIASISAQTTYYLRAKSAAQVDSPYGNIEAVRIA